MTAIHFEESARALHRCSARVPQRNGQAPRRGGCSATFRAWRRRARDRADLAALDDRMLPISASAGPMPISRQQTVLEGEMSDPN